MIKRSNRLALGGLINRLFAQRSLTQPAGTQPAGARRFASGFATSRLAKGLVAKTCSLTLALALLVAPFASLRRAEAACTLTGTTVDCTGTTIDQQGGGVGFGTAADNNLTYNIGTAAVPGATVTGTATGVVTGAGGTFNNFGSISGVLTGISTAPGTTTTTVNNLLATSVIEATGAGGDNFALNADIVAVDNKGIIRSLGAGGKAIVATTAIVNNSNNIAGAGAAIQAGTVNLTGNTGIITGSAAGIEIAGTTNTINNTNTISGTGTTGIGIHAKATTGTTTIDASGNNGASADIFGTVAGIKADGALSIANGTGHITGDLNNANSIGIEAAGTLHLTGNAGTISGVVAGLNSITGSVIVDGNTGSITSTAANGTGIFGLAVNVIGNTGTIQATGTGSTAITAAVATVNNSNLISGTSFGINSLLINVTGNTGTIQATNTTTGIAIQAGDAGSTSTITNLVGGQIKGGNLGINITSGAGVVTNAGLIEGNGGTAVQFNGTGANVLTLQTGSQLNGAAVGSVATGASNALVLQGNGLAANAFTNFNTLDVQANGLWALNGNSIIGASTVSSGALVLGGALSSNVAVNGGALGGTGTVTGNVTVASGAIIAPGVASPFSTLNVSANTSFDSGSQFQVKTNAAGQNDKLTTATASLSGGIVQVLMQGSGFLPSTQYTILTATAGLNGTTFSDVIDNSIFLDAQLSYDTNNVFLTLLPSAFSSVAQTPNQVAVANALDASPTGSALVTALLGQQTAEGARQAFDALSGEIFASVQNVLVEKTQFIRNAVLGRLRQAGYVDASGEQGALGFGGPDLANASLDAYAADMKTATKAPAKAPSRDLTFWAQGLGGWGHVGSDGNAAKVSDTFAGFITGVDTRVGDTLRAGFVAGYTGSDLKINSRGSRAGIDSAEVGVYAGGNVAGALNVRSGATYSFDTISTDRTIAFPGFFDQTHARFNSSVGQVFGELGYGMTINHVAVEPLAGLAYVHVHTGALLENGGVAALAGESNDLGLGYSTLGVRMATVVPLANGTLLVPRASLQWQHAFGDVNPTAALAFQSTGAAFAVGGVPIARDAALVESGVDWRFSPQVKFGVAYQGTLATNAQIHMLKGAFTSNF